MAKVINGDFRQWKINEELISRIRNGDTAAVSKVFNDNYDFIYHMARKYYWTQRKFAGYYLYEIGDLVNQVFEDFIYYRWQNALTLYLDIKLSFSFIGQGGYRHRKRKSPKFCISLDTPVQKDEADGATLGDFIESAELSAYDLIVQKEDALNSMGIIFNTVKKTFEKLNISEKRREMYTAYTLETIFRGYTYERIKCHVKEI